MCQRPLDLFLPPFLVVFEESDPQLKTTYEISLVDTNGNLYVINEIDSFTFIHE